MLVGFTFVEEEKLKERKYWIHKVFRAREEEGEFHNLFGRLKDKRQIFSNILLRVFRNLKP